IRSAVADRLLGLLIFLIFSIVTTAYAHYRKGTHAMHPKAPRFIESRSRTLLIRTVLFLVLGTFALSSVALGGMARHPRQLPLSGTVRLEQGPVPAPTVSPSSDVTALPPTLDAGSPTYETLDFVEAQGGIFSIPYDRLAALAMNAPRSVIVIEAALYQAIVEGSRLEPVYRQIQKRQINCLEASSFANGETYCNRSRRPGRPSA